MNKFWILVLPLLVFAACERTKSGASDAPARAQVPPPGEDVGIVEDFPDRPDLAARLRGMRDVDSGSEYTLEQAHLDTDVGSRAYFDFNKYDIRADAASVLRGQAEWLMDNPEIRINIAGHCDARGSREYNLALGDRRANAVKDFLVSQGIASARLATVSYGKERPAVVGDTEAAYALNRRAVTSVSR